MGDFPAQALNRAVARRLVSNFDPTYGLWGDFARVQALAAPAAAVWPSANRAIYCGVMVPEPLTIYQLGTQVTTQSGNLDIGIYDEQGNKLVSSGSTTVAAAGVQLVNVADTDLTPGLYFLALAVDNITAAFLRAAPGLPSTRVALCGQEAAAFPLPASFTYAIQTAAYIPDLFAPAWSATI
jgi:hypothetical protein